MKEKEVVYTSYTGYEVGCGKKKNKLKGGRRDVRVVVVVNGPR